MGKLMLELERRYYGFYTGKPNKSWYIHWPVQFMYWVQCKVDHLYLRYSRPDATLARKVRKLDRTIEDLPLANYETDFGERIKK